MNTLTIKAAVTPLDYLESIGFSYSPCGDSMRGSCPLCDGTDGTSSKFSITGDLWHCFSCDTGGDVFTLLEKYLEMPLPNAIAFLCEEFGVVDDGGVYSEKPNARQEDLIRRRVESNHACAAVAQRMWDNMGSGSTYTGTCEYAASRGINMSPGPFYRLAESAIVVPLFGLDGEIVNLVGRKVSPEPGEPKVVGLRGGASAGTLCTPQLPGRRAVIVEGVFDTLTALQFDVGPVYGAHGASNLLSAAMLCVGRVQAAVVVVHNDPAGRRAGARVLDALWGFDIDCRACVCPEGKDLNDIAIAGDAEEFLCL